MVTINTRSNKYEDAVIITSEDGQVIEAVVIHICDTDIPTFAIGTYNSNGENIEDSYQELFTCPVQAA